MPLGKLEIEESDAELRYRQKNYPDVSKVIKEGEVAPKCTVCDEVVDSDEYLCHPLLKVLLCKDCLKFYNDGEFSTDEDGEEKYCRWCGDGGDMYGCNKCPVVFCKKCVKLNFGKSLKNDLQRDDWECFVCNVKPLWDKRAYCWALMAAKKEKTRKMKAKSKAVLEKLSKKKPEGRPQRGTRRRDSSSSESSSESDSDPSQKKKHTRGGKKVGSSVMSNGVSDSSDSDFEEPKPKSKPLSRQVKNKKKTVSEESSDDEEEYGPKRSAKQKGKGHAKGKDDSYIDSSAFVDKRQSSKTAKSKLKKKKPTEDSESLEDENSEIEFVKISSNRTSKPVIQKKGKKPESSGSEYKPKAKKPGKKAESEASDSSSEEESTSEVQKSSKLQQKTPEKCKIVDGTSEVNPAPSPGTSRHVTDWMAKCSKSDGDTTEVSVAEPVVDADEDQEMEELDSDGSSKQGGMGSDETGVNWLEQLITDASAYSLNFSQRVEKVQQNFSENMDKEAIHQSCKTLYNLARKSLIFFERHKTSVKQDYGEWMDREQKRTTKKIQQKQRKSMSKVMQTTSQDDSLNLPNSEPTIHSDSSNDATASQGVASKPKNNDASDSETDARKSLKSKQNADCSPPKPKTKPKIGPKSKIQRKTSSESSSDEQYQSPLVNTGKSEEKNVSFTNEANDQVNVDSTADEEKIQSSLAVLQEVVADVDKSLTQDTIEKLSKTLDAGKACRMSVDPFDDEDEDGVEDRSIQDRSTVCEETPDFDNTSETTRRKILEADTEPENTLPPVDSQKTHFEEGEEEVDETQIDPEEKKKILEETTQQINPNLLKVDPTKLDRCSTATTHCESSDEDMDASDVVCEPGEVSKLSVSVVSAYTTSGDELPDSKTVTAKPDAYISLLESSSSSDEDRGSTKHHNGTKSNTSPNTTENLEPSELDDKEDKPQEKSDDENAQSISAETPEHETKKVESEVKVSPTKRKIGPKSKMKPRRSEDSDSEVSKKASKKEQADENETTENLNFDDSVDNAISENGKMNQTLEKDSSQSECEDVSKSANNLEPDLYNSLAANSSEEDPVEQTEDKKSTSSKPKKKLKSSEPDQYNALLVDSSSEDDSKSNVTKKSSKKKIGPKSRTRRNWLDRIPSPDIDSTCNLDEFEDNRQLTTKCYVALGRRCKDKEAALDRQIENLMNLSSLETKRERKSGGKKSLGTKKSTKKGKDEDGNISDMDSDSDAGEHLEQLEHALAADRPRNEQDQLLDAILVSSDSGPSSAELSDGDGKEKKDKKKKKSTTKAAVKTEKQEEADSEDGAEKERKKKKAAWRNAKELKNPLSDSDESVPSDKDGSILQKMKDREKNELEKSGSDEELSVKSKSTKAIKKARRRVLDSDVEILSDEEKEKGDSDSSDDFVINKKKKRARESSSSSSSSDSFQDSKKKVNKRRRIRKPASDSSSDDDVVEVNESQRSEGTPGKRRNIRKVLKGRDLEEATREAAREEEERRKRIAQRQILYNQMVEEQHTVGESIVKELVLDFDEKSKKPILQVHEKLVAKLKPHQAQGVKFMWDALFESVERAQKNRGSGCILAHCMGLGKTMQVVTLVHTLLTHPELEMKIRTVLIVTPLSTVNNWCQEFRMWLDGIDDDDEVQCFNFTLAKPRERAIFLKNWQKHGGVAVMGYDMFRNLSNYANSRTNKSTREIYQRCLIDPGPDMVVCDEGHMLKNENSKLSQCMSQLTTNRRVALTGTPLQNNLIEYHCMIQFVKPNLLGKRKEFTNRFVNPIKNGQCADSTPRDVFIMKKRAHVLHKMLEGCVQRFDYSVLTPLLKPKQEYVIKIRLTDIQVKLYQHFLNNFARQALVNKGASLFSDYQNLQRLWTHPLVLKFRADRDEKTGPLDDEEEDSEGSLKDFIDDDEDSAKSTASSKSGSGSDSDVICEEGDGKGTKRKKKDKEDNAKRYRTRGAVANGEVEEVNEKEYEGRGRSQWWHEFVNEDDFDILAHSNKMVMLFNVLRECEAIGDKVLVFSQSLLSLDLIEAFLRKVDDATHSDGDTSQFCGLKGSWNLGSDYFRLDGSCSTENRSMWCKIFNNPKNLRARLFLISTRAGGLGINMVGANRVVLFDASWNPSNDVQSIFRVYRFGQTKPCYIYRFLAAGTMEEKIYDRQVTKLALSGRVVDEHQIDRHFNAADLEELYSFTPPTSDVDRPTMLVPKDRLLAELLKEHQGLVEGYLEHDSLLENKPEENLTEEERQAAWEDYEREKNMDAYRLQMQEQQIAQQQEMMQERARQFQLGLANTTDVNMKEALETLTQLVSLNTAAVQTPKTANDFNNIMNVSRELARGNPAAIAYLAQERQRLQQQQAQQNYQRQLQQYQQSLLLQQQQQRNQASTSAATPASGPKIIELADEPSTDPKPKLKLREDLY